MSQVNDTQNMALNIEEAALLPALPRQGGAASSALQGILRQAQQMDTMLLSPAVEGMIGNEAPAQTAAALITPAPAANTYRQPNSRAALHQVLWRR